MESVWTSLRAKLILCLLLLSGAITAHALQISATAVVVKEAGRDKPVLAKNHQHPMPIASITKLMTAIVILDSSLDLEAVITITRADIDRIKNSSSRVAIGSKLTREQLIHLALMSSDNRAAHALGRTYPGGVYNFVRAMNRKARILGLTTARFVDPSGLSKGNVASPLDVANLALIAQKYELIKKYSSYRERTFNIRGRRVLFRNTNSLVRNQAWPISLSKTGFTREAGRCIVMYTKVDNKDYVLVLMDAATTQNREMDAIRIRHWLADDNFSSSSTTFAKAPASQTRLKGRNLHSAKKAKKKTKRYTVKKRTKKSKKKSKTPSRYKSKSKKK